MATAPYVQDVDLTVYNGDALTVLRELPAESVHCALTSPPFYGLRDYGVDGQIGLEETPDEWVERLVAVFAEVRRVLRTDGTLWVECGDSYGSPGLGGSSGKSTLEGGGGRYREGSKLLAMHESGQGKSRRVAGVKPKDLLGQPWMLAFALRAAGWWLRQAIIWHKPNAMPESATDRCTTAHSYVFLLSKSARYWFDGQAIGEPFSPGTIERSYTASKARAMAPKNGDDALARTMGGMVAPFARSQPQAETLDGSEGEAPRGADGRRVTHVEKGENSVQPRNGERWPNEQRHPRSVWTIPTQPYPGAHFATWPEALVERILKAGCPEGGTCLDPFFGSGTTGLVARHHGRRTIGIELNESYCAMAAARLGQQSLLAEPAA